VWLKGNFDLQANRAVERAAAEGSFASGDVSGSPRAGLFANTPRQDAFADSPRAEGFLDSPRRGALASPKRRAFIDSLQLGPAGDTLRAGQFGASPQGKGHAVPEWLNSPRSSSAGSKRLTPDSSFGGGLLGSPPGQNHRAESISPRTTHILSVFSHPQSRRVSSEPSTEAAPHIFSEEKAGAFGKLSEDQKRQADAAASGQAPSEVTWPLLCCSYRLHSQAILECICVYLCTITVASFQHMQRGTLQALL